MSKKSKAVILTVLILGVLVALVLYLHTHTIDVLSPKGVVASKERQLMYYAVGLGLLVIIPVYIMTAMIAWKYREGNKKAKYSPDWNHNAVLEITWWAIPCAIIAVLAVLTWTSSHALDPYKPLTSHNKQLNIQVVSLDWKWLFIYPEQNIASVNSFTIPVNTPVDFYITSDSVMNSFWIPRLGGQIYSMPGMSTQLHLQASSVGRYNGVSANISGKGFAGMTFVANATSSSNFTKWVQKVKSSSADLDIKTYNQLAEPSKDNKVAYYASAEDGLYNDIVMKYMVPGLADALQTVSTRE
jgi:cytochrome o ubiquinol oxidase subunit 2